MDAGSGVGVSKKTQREQPAAPISTRKWVVLGVGVIALTALLGVGIVTAFGGASLSEKDPEVPQPPALTGEPPLIERSAAAELLEGTSFDDMTQAERDLVRDEATRVFAEAEFRATSIAVLAIDVVRRDGTTHATRQFKIGESPGGALILQDIRSFYCDSPAEGFLDAYRTTVTPIGTTTGGDRIGTGTQAFDREMTAVDWTQTTDLGYDEVLGRRVHGVEVPFATLGGGSIRREMWFDVETARVLRHGEVTPEGIKGEYTFDWRKPPRIESTAELGIPPCYAEIYPDAVTPS